MIQFSDNQKDIFREVLNTINHILVKATAGSGKTTTLVEIAKLLPKDMKAIFVAFNKSIVEELSKKLPSGFNVSTLHSLGLDMLYRAYGSGVTLNENKTFRFANEVFKGSDLPSNEVNKRKYNLIDAWNYIRVTMTDVEDLESLVQTLERFDIYSEELIEDIHSLHPRIMGYNNAARNVGDRFEIDFTDMIYLPVVLKKVRPVKYDLVMVDECQDLNLCQHQLLDMIMGRNGRMIAVGDPQQAIYGFSGSDSQSFAKFMQRPGTISLPLSVSYRCAKKIVEEAQKYSPEICHWHGADEGVVGWQDLYGVRPGDFVLCRNNRPLIEAYFDLIALGEKAYILGAEIGDQFIKMVKPFIAKPLSQLYDHLDQKLEGIHDKLLEKGVKNPERTDEYRIFRDNSLAIKIIGQRCTSVPGLIKRIEDIFHPQKDAIVLSSIHKSKGLEADRVFILRWDLLPSKYASTPEAIMQERNLQFVAVTRAKKELYFVPWNDEIKPEKDLVNTVYNE